MTSTALLDIRAIRPFSGGRFIEINLPLLSVPHVYEIIIDLAKRCQRNVNDGDGRKKCPFTDANASADQLLKTYPLFSQLLQLIGGNCRFVEILLFIFGSCPPMNNAFYPTQFISSLSRLNDSTFLGKIRASTIDAIVKRYPVYANQATLCVLAPRLVAYSLFGYLVRRTSSFENGITVQILEQMGVITVIAENRRCSSSFGHSSGSPCTATTAKESSSDVNDYDDVTIRMPFIWLQYFYRSTMDISTSLADIPLLSSNQYHMNSDNNERLSLLIMMLKIYYGTLFPEVLLRYGSSSSSSSVPSSSTSIEIPLSFLVPLRKEQKDIMIKFPRVITNWNLVEASHQVTRNNFMAFVKDQKNLFIMNKLRAPFADSIILSNPPLLIQDKQSVVYRQQVVQKADVKEEKYSVIKAEHDKCQINNLDHIFIFTTDLPLSQSAERNLTVNEVVIHKENAHLFYGELLLLLKTYCIETREGISVCDSDSKQEGPTVTTEWQLAPQSNSCTSKQHR